jgi:hypothetical protein
MATIIINPEDWQLKTAAEGGLPSSSHNGAAVMDSSTLNAPRSQLLHDANPFLCILEQPANHHSAVHYHTEPELMIVLKGKMLLNGVWCHAGAVIFYEANQHYWHATGDEPCVTALLRPGDRGYMHWGPQATARSADDRAS